jgi:hypothetical protein
MSPAGASRTREIAEAEPQGFAARHATGVVTGVGGLDGGGMMKIGVVGSWARSVSCRRTR